MRIRVIYIVDTKDIVLRDCAQCMRSLTKVKISCQVRSAHAPFLITFSVQAIRKWRNTVPIPFCGTHDGSLRFQSMTRKEKCTRLEHFDERISHNFKLSEINNTFKLEISETQTLDNFSFFAAFLSQYFCFNNLTRLAWYILSAWWGIVWNRIEA